MKRVKIVLIGVGSVTFGRGTIASLLSSKELSKLKLNIVLVDIDKEFLNIMYKFAQILKRYYKSKASIEATTSHQKALPGADYVITAVARNRMRLWEQDFYIPNSFGFAQIFGENGGPGAAFHTLRSLHIMIPIAKDMEKLCPQAFLINFSNPESRVCLGIYKLTRINAVGLCHGAFGTHQIVADILNRKEKDVEISIGGINHFHWVLNIKEKTTGKDLYPEFHQKMKISEGKIEPLACLMYKKFGFFPFPRDSHIGEYVSFGHQVSGPIHWLNMRKRYEALSEIKEKIRETVENKKTLRKELTLPSKELDVPIICDIEFNHNRREISVNLPNKDLTVSNLPKDAIVEVPAVVNKAGIHPIKVGPLPEAIASLCRTQISIQNLLVEAYKKRSKKLLLQALILEPVVNNITRAEEMMKEMLATQQDFLPEFR